MAFCDSCKDMWYELTDGLCPSCIAKKNRPPKPPKVVSSPPRPPIQVSTKKPAPKPIELIPHLEQIAKYRTKVGGGQTKHPTKSQREIIEKIQDYIKNNKTRIVISAPTGSGKSWIAATLANAYDIVILTSTNDLQDQYCGTEDGTPGDFDFMNAVRGKGQYLCEESGNTKNCSEAYCHGCDYLVYDEHVQIGNVGPRHEQKIFSKPEDELCKYFKADMIGKKSKYSVYSYASYIARMKAEKFETEPKDKLPDKTVLVCDEAHDYDKVVSDCLLVKIDGELNRELIGKSLPIFSGLDNAQQIEKTRDFIEKVLDEIKNYLKNKKECAKHSNILSSKKHLEEHRELRCDIHDFKYDKKCKLCLPMKKFLKGECFECNEREHLELLKIHCTRSLHSKHSPFKNFFIGRHNLHFLSYLKSCISHLSSLCSSRCFFEDKIFECLAHSFLFFR
jgi:Rad3-related DNA helicase